MEKLLKFIDKVNIADDIDKDTLATIGADVWEGYDLDKKSREDWETQNEAGMKLARQLGEDRTYAGENVSNVMYPLIAQASIQYAARAYPAIVKGEEVVKFKVIGYDKENKKAARGERVAKHMNTQILDIMDGWETDMDQLLISQPVLGVYYKKTYFDPVESVNRSELVSPEYLVMDYFSKSVEKAYRKTHVLEYTHNEYLEFVNSGVWKDIDLKEPEDKYSTHKFLEQHGVFDLDDDDYKEPYIVTIEEESQKVVRIVARFDKKGIFKKSDGTLKRIKPIENFTEFKFMPSFDGGVYGMGFGILLSPLNHSINTLINQLLDAGSRSNRQAGFLGRGVRLLRGGESGSWQFKQGEWKQVQCSGDDLRKNIVPLPAGEPSAVLFQLLGFLVDVSKELASQAEVLSGQQTQHNVPATSTLALIEQGLKVFSGIYKRTYHALKNEFKKLHRLNAKYLTNLEYATIIDNAELNAVIGQQPDGPVRDYQMEDYDIRPVSSTTAITETQKYIKAEAVRSWYGTGLNDKQIAAYWFESMEIPDFEKFIQSEQQGPPPEFQLKMEELKLKHMELQLKIFELISKDNERRAKQKKMEAEGIKTIAEAEAVEVGPQLDMYKAQLSEIGKQISEMNQINKEMTIAKLNSAGMGNAQGQRGGGQTAPQPQGAA